METKKRKSTKKRLKRNGISTASQLATIVVRSGTKNSDGSCVHMMPLFSEIIDFYANAREYCVKAGFQWEIDAVQNRYFKNIDIGDFLEAYVFCVFNV